MTKACVSRELRRRLVAEARGRCAYCHTLTAVTGARLVVGHIIPEAAGGRTVLDNLCLACHSYNEFKGTQLRAYDPLTGKHVRVFHPRQDRWRDHFRWSPDGSELAGITPTDRARLLALKMNHPLLVEARRLWVAVGWHPPQEDE